MTNMQLREDRPLEIRAKVRAVDTEKREVTARVLTFGKADTYGTVWMPEVFDDSLQVKLPKFLWSHNGADIIGKGLGYNRSDEALDITFKLSDPEAVPRAKQALAQLADGSVDEFSVGFRAQDWDPVPEDQMTAYGENIAFEFMKRGKLVEVSCVLEGAVPGTKLLAMRSNDRISREDAGSLLARVSSGDLSLREALDILDGSVDAGNTSEAPEAPERAATATSEVVVEVAPDTAEFVEARIRHTEEGVEVRMGGETVVLDEETDGPEDAKTEVDAALEAEIEAALGKVADATSL